MFACLHVASPQESCSGLLREIASRFSPQLEWHGSQTVVFSIDGLGKLFGSPAQIASEVARLGTERGLCARLAVARYPDTALLAARSFAGVTLIPAGQERRMLGDLDLRALAVPEEIRDLLVRWGIRTLGEFAALPPLGVVERLGAEGLRLQDMARGAYARPLRPGCEPQRYERFTELDHPIGNVQPLLFLINGMLGELCREMEHSGVAARQVTLTCTLMRARPDHWVLNFPVPIRQVAPIRKLLQLAIEADPPAQAVTALSLQLSPAEPQRLQNGLFTAAAPEPARLQITLARIAAVIGEENIGSAELLQTHRPDSFQLKPYTNFDARPAAAAATTAAAVRHSLAFRIYRPARSAQVAVDRGRPRHVEAAGVAGEVLDCAGPWRGSGDWWTTAPWARDEWDVALSDGGLYRVFQEPARMWFVAGVYD